MSLFTVPVVLGGGKELFADGSAPHSFKLTRFRVSPNGLIALTFFTVLRVSAEDPGAGLPSVIPDTEYRAAFLKLARNLAPSKDGEGHRAPSLRLACPVMGGSGFETLW